MRTYDIAIDTNGEYIGYMMINCEKLQIENDKVIYADGVRIEFDGFHKIEFINDITNVKNHERAY